jgi:DNA-binding protein HU-beta
MNKAELVAKISETTNVPKKDAEAAVNAFMGAVKDSLKAGEPVQLIGFGTFGVKVRNAREARNPRTGEKIKIKKTTVPTFKPGKGLKEALN